MTDYHMKGSKDDVFDEIQATHPAHPGTYLIYAFKDGEPLRENVILWAVHPCGELSPITMHGVWGGSNQTNICVLHPDGRCQSYDRVYASLDEAVADLKQYDKSENGILRGVDR